MVSLGDDGILFSSIFENAEVVRLLSKISTNPRYYDKRKKDSINYEKFSGLEQPIFLAIDSLLKYQILIGDEKYLIDYLRHLDLDCSVQFFQVPLILLLMFLSHFLHLDFYLLPLLLEFYYLQFPL